MRNSMNHPSLALCLAALTALSASVSCEKTPGAGSGVSFRAKADGTTTKTAYGDISGNTQDYQMLNWESGDVIRVYSPQAVKIYTADVHFADYKVDGVKTEGTTSVATLLSSDDGNGLGWQESGTHYFYSVYPSTDINGSSTITAGTGNSVTVTGTIPATQTLSWSGVLGTPDMRYAYMYAATRTAPNNKVDLNFTPMFTAFQFEIGPGDYSSLHLTQFTLSTGSTSRTLAGTFTLSGVQGSETVNCSAGANTLTVNMDATLTSGHTLTLTVFAQPQALTELTIAFKGEEIGTCHLALKKDNSWLNFAAGRKYRFYGLKFPKVDSLTADGETIIWNGDIDILSGGELISWNAGTAVDAAGELISWCDQLLGASGDDLSWGSLFFVSAGGDALSWSAAATVTSAGEGISIVSSAASSSGEGVSLGGSNSGGSCGENISWQTGS